VIYPFFKRLFDVLVSFTLIVVLTPVWMAAAVAVKFSSPGPLFFVQTRGGRDGKSFSLIKFRTMRAGHVHDPTEIMPLSHPGITRVGHVLRRTKIDELPQLLNVLIGDMSIVGPRPTIMDQIVCYDAFQRRRLKVRPGCTGLAQVNSNATMSWDERIRYDVYYVDHLTACLDAMILLKTVAVVLLGELRFSRPFDESPYAKRTQDHQAS